MVVSGSSMARCVGCEEGSRCWLACGWCRWWRIGGDVSRLKLCFAFAAEQEGTKLSDDGDRGRSRIELSAAAIHLIWQEHPMTTLFFRRSSFKAMIHFWDAFGTAISCAAASILGSNEAICREVHRCIRDASLDVMVVLLDVLPETCPFPPREPLPFMFARRLFNPCAPLRKPLAPSKTP